MNSQQKSRHVCQLGLPYTLYIVFNNEIQHDFYLHNGIFVSRSECVSAKVKTTGISVNYPADTGDFHIKHNYVSE